MQFFAKTARKLRESCVKIAGFTHFRRTDTLYTLLSSSNLRHPLIFTLKKNIAPTPKAPNPEQAKDEIADLELKLEQMSRVKEAARAAAN